jgi:glutamate:GABA antiporter
LTAPVATVRGMSTLLHPPPDAAPARRQHARLRRELDRFDTVFFLISAMVVVDTIGAIAIGGAQALTWLVVLFVLFFIPSALASAELGAAIPEEGGAYVWVRMAFGRFAGAVTSLLYWAGTPMWLGGSVTVVAIAVVERFFGELGTSGAYAFGSIFIGAATLGAVVPLRFGKWVPTTGAIGQIVLLAFFTGTVAVYGLEHGVHGLAVGDVAPTFPVFIAVVPVLLYSFVGIELPSAAAEEMVDPRRDIPAAIARAGACQAAMYAIPIVAVLVVLPPERITSLHGLIDAMQTVFAVYGGAAGLVGGLSAALFVWVLLASGSAWIIGAGRAQAAACLDGAGPAVLGRIAASGVPVIIGLVSGALSLLTMAADLAVTGGAGQRYFSAALTVSIALIVLAYLFVFPAFIALRLRRPELVRPFRVPGGTPVAWAVSIIATAWSLLAAACLLWPGFGLADPDAALPGGFEGDRLQFEALVLTPIALVVVLACVFYRLGVRDES